MKMIIIILIVITSRFYALAVKSYTFSCAAAKSDSEMYGDLASQRKPKGEKQNIRKQQKLRLDQK